MIPIIPTLAIAFVSFISSAFVVLRILVPILPPHPLSRRVPPSEFGLPNFRSLTPADKSHVWLASCDLIALAMFIWQAVQQHLSGTNDYHTSHDSGSAVRLWIAMTLRQGCLFVVASLALVHVRIGRPVAFGRKHWMLWAPTLLLAVTSTSLAGVLAATNVSSLFIGLVAYSTTIAVASSAAFLFLIGTLVVIRRNLDALNEIRDPWPPAKEVDEMPRPSFATEDVDALRDGSSWITSRASSRSESISAFSFSTHHSAKPSNASARMMSQHPAAASNPSIPPKSSFWFNPAAPYAGRESPVPPVPPLPAPYRPPSPGSLNDDPDPFRRNEPRSRMGSQSSWLTESSVSQPTLTAWSFPTTCHEVPPASSTQDLLPSTAVSRPITPAMASAQVLGGYGYSPEAAHAEKGLAALTSVPASDLDVSIYRAIGWLLLIWIPWTLGLPYLATVSASHPVASPVMSVLLILSVTLSSPLLALNILFRSPLPIPTGLFETYDEPPSMVMRTPSPYSLPPIRFSHEYKRSGSITVVEGRRSGDVWLSNGDAVDSKSKLGRAIGLLHPKPKLSVLPPGEDVQEAELTPPLPMQTEDSGVRLPETPQSQNSAELGQKRTRKDSKASSYYSGASDSVAFATQIMIAQRHYSALATTMVVPPSPDRHAALDNEATGLSVSVSGVQAAQDESTRRHSHLRARSVSSVNGGNFSMSPPPASPLPPTPPSVRERKARLAQHRKSQSQSSASTGFSFGAVANDSVGEIDALSAHLLPLLVPGLKIGADMKIREGWTSPMSTLGTSAKRGNTKGTRTVPQELGGLSSDFSSPELHSTPPLRMAAPREQKMSTHKRHHFSLPSLSLGKDGIHALTTWRNDLNQALEGGVGQYFSLSTNDINRRKTVLGNEVITPAPLNVVMEEDEHLRPSTPGAHLTRATSTHAIGATPPHSADVPSGVNTARNSLAILITALDQELRMPHSANSDATLFEFDNVGPQAESTPYETHKAHSRPSSQNAPPVPKLPEDMNTNTRRSSIVYIRSDENAAPSPKQSSISPKSFSEWSTRAVRPLVPKSKAKKSAQSSAAGVPGSPSGLRPLSLLQDRDVNRDASIGTRALAAKKKQKKTDENANPYATAKKGLKPLKLVRNDTTKARALLRKDEVLPDVVVRPPSTHESHHAGTTFTFR
ncbi:hypothetical protein BKA93DRAFT_925199 [Sparassis latifolia]